MKYKVGEEVTLRLDSRHYTSNYAGTKVLIKKIDCESYCTVEGFDGKEFMLPYMYIDTSHLPPLIAASCTCGAYKTWGTDCPRSFHSDYCPLYKPRE